MAYTVLARRYRSQSFGHVVGQQPIAQTLRNAIAGGRIHHAYLFCGTRGVGKTSMARLLARALNASDTVEDCPKPPDHDKYPPKDVQQRMADAIMRGDDLNVIEIDAASNTGVDNVREIIANAGLAPTDNARYKVYIIDEVHMLSKQAFNALLKIMEEPPSHVKFILCTTEPEKVLPTIQSRCQRFDFRNISTKLIAEHLADVLKRENVEAEERVIFEIARQANGSMRDALSLMDRLLAAGESPITGELVEKMLGLPDRQLLLELVDAMIDADVAKTLRAADELLQRGVSQDQFISTLTEHLRHLMIVAACGPDTPLIDLDEQSRKQLADQSQRFDTPALIHAIAMLENTQRSARQSSAPRALLDATLARLAMSDKFADAAALAAGAKDGRTTTAPPAEKKKLPPLPAEVKSPPQPAHESHVVSRPPLPPGEGRGEGVTSASSQSPVDPTADLWQTILADTAGQAPLSYLQSLEWGGVAGQTVTLRLKPGERSRLAFIKTRLDAIQRLLADRTGQRLKVNIEAPPVAVEIEDVPVPQRGRLTEQDKLAAMNMPLTRQVVDLFDANLLDIRPRKQSSASDESVQ